MNSSRSPMLVRSFSPARVALAAVLLIGSATLGTLPAAAVVNSSVRSACMADYFAYCAGMEVGSTQLRRCMSRAGPRLAPACVSALVAAGEVSQAEVNRRGGNAKPAVKVASKAKTKVASKGGCVAGPARPGAKSASVCRQTNRGKSAKRQYATLR